MSERTVWDSKHGPAKSLRVRPYRGKRERREVIKERRQKRGTVRGEQARKV